MDIGEEKPAIVVEPAQDPFRVEPEPTPARSPERERETVPEREREKVGGRS